MSHDAKTAEAVAAISAALLASHDPDDDAGASQHEALVAALGALREWAAPFFRGHIALAIADLTEPS
jgi:hypothetical protein